MTRGGPRAHTAADYWWRAAVTRAVGLLGLLLLLWRRRLGVMPPFVLFLLLLLLRSGLRIQIHGGRSCGRAEVIVAGIVAGECRAGQFASELRAIRDKLLWLLLQLMMVGRGLRGLLLLLQLLLFPGGAD